MFRIFSIAAVLALSGAVPAWAANQTAGAIGAVAPMGVTHAAPPVSLPHAAPQISLPHAAPQISGPRPMAPFVGVRPLAIPHSIAPETSIISMPRIMAEPSHAHPSMRSSARLNHSLMPRTFAAPGQHLRNLDEGRGVVGVGSGSLVPQGAQVRSSQAVGEPVRPKSTGREGAVLERVLRNPALVGPGELATGVRSAARFAGRFFDVHWREHHLPRPIVIGWAGPLFWPYAYEDFLDYTLYAYAFDTFWPYVYDDIYAGMFPYAEIYSNLAVESDESPDVTQGPVATKGGGICNVQLEAATNWPIEQIWRAIEPDDAQRAALADFKKAVAKAIGLLQDRCPAALPSTPTARIETMRQRLVLMLQAVRIVRAPMEVLYALLDDEQKARLNALSSPEDTQGETHSLVELCDASRSYPASLMVERIEQAVQPDDEQRLALKLLEEAASGAAAVLRSDCPSDQPLTPIGRLQAMERRLDATLRAIETVEPVLEKFYGALTREQKQRFDRLSPPADDQSRSP